MKNDNNNLQKLLMISDKSRLIKMREINNHCLMINSQIDELFRKKLFIHYGLKDRKDDIIKCEYRISEINKLIIAKTKEDGLISRNIKILNKKCNKRKLDMKMKKICEDVYNVSLTHEAIQSSYSNEIVSKELDDLEVEKNMIETDLQVAENYYQTLTKQYAEMDKDKLKNLDDVIKPIQNYIEKKSEIKTKWMNMKKSFNN